MESDTQSWKVVLNLSLSVVVTILLSNEAFDDLILGLCFGVVKKSLIKYYFHEWGTGKHPIPKDSYYELASMNSFDDQ